MDLLLETELIGRWKKVAAMRTSPEQQLISPAIAWNVQWLKVRFFLQRNFSR